jgi:MFS family permease
MSQPHVPLMKSLRALRHLAGLDYADAATLPEEQRRGMRDMYVNGILSNFSDNATSSYAGLFMVAMGATDAQIGFLSTLAQALAALAPVPGAMAAERLRAYHLSVFLPSLTARIGYLALAALPLLQVGQPLIAVATLVFALRSFLVSFTSAPWTAMMGQLAPAWLRARYFSARNFAISIAIIAGTTLAGQMINRLGFPLGYQAVFVMSAVTGFVASYIFARLPRFAFARLEAGRPRAEAAAGAAKPASRPPMAALLRHGPYARYMACSCALAFAVNVGGPFIGLYQVRVLHFDAATIGLMTSAQLAMSIVMGRVYGSVVIPRFGDFRVMRALRLLVPLLPLAWLLVRDPFLGVLVSLAAGAIWSGHELANFNGLLDVTPEDRRAIYLAVHTVTTSLSSALGPAIGGLLSGMIGYHPLFVASAALCLLSALLFVVLVRDWAARA